MTPAVRDWAKAFALIAAAWAGVFILLHPTGANMVAIWERSETYAYGYVVLPISLWLVWRKRHLLMSTPAVPEMRALIPVAAAAALWLVAKAVSVNVAEQYAFVGVLITSVWVLLGTKVARVMLFPLLFLLMMVPNGDNFMPQLMDFTADFAVFTVRLLGLPVYREGTFFSLPSGDWSVVEACSGIRYILSSLTLGMLYAYMTYRTLWKRALFTLAALVVPIFANGMRASLIVLIAHYSDMTLALGVDHYIYGWVWFGIVMVSMFAIGNLWREDTLADDRCAHPAVSPRFSTLPIGLLVAVVAVFPWYEAHLAKREITPSPLGKVVPSASWTISETPLTEWVPTWKNPDDQRTLSLERGGDRVLLVLGWYGAQRQGAELINFDNQLVPQEHRIWRKTSEVGRTVEVGDQSLDLREAKVDAPLTGQHLLVWYWNRVAGEATTSAARIKLALGMRKLRGADDAGAVVIIAAPYQDRPETAEAVLRRFVADMQPTLNPVLDRREP